MEYIIPIAAFFFGAFFTFVFRLWDRLTPETRLQWRAQTTSIPMREGMPYDTFTIVTLANPSRRSKATNLRLTITVRAKSTVEVGAPTTTDDPSTIHITSTPPNDDYTVHIQLHAERLAPRSTIELPMWYSTLSHVTRVSVQGACDQATITPENEARRPDFTSALFYTALAFLAVTFLAMSAYLYVTSRARSAATAKLTSEMRWLTEPRREVAITLAAAPPSPPGITLRNPNTLLVTQSPDASSTCLLRADAPDGDFTVYSIPLHRPQETAVVKLTQPHSAFWIRAYSENDFGRSRPSAVIAVPPSPPPPVVSGQRRTN